VATFTTYRNGRDAMETRIKAAVQAFYSDRQRLPASIVVNKAELDAAREACEALALRVEVEGMGGALANEVWLELPEEAER